MLPLAVSIIKTTATNFRWIYSGDTIYPSVPLPRSYPHFLEVRFLCDYLINTIKHIQIPRRFYSSPESKRQHRRIMWGADERFIMNSPNTFSNWKKYRQRLTTLKYQRLDDLVTAIGLPRELTADTLAGERIESMLTTAPGNSAAIGGLKVVTANGWFAARPRDRGRLQAVRREIPRRGPPPAAPGGCQGPRRAGILLPGSCCVVMIHLCRKRSWIVTRSARFWMLY